MSPNNNGSALTKEDAWTEEFTELLSLSTRPRFITHSLYASLSIIAVLLPISNQNEEWTYRFHSPRMFTSGSVQKTLLTRGSELPVRAASAAVIVIASKEIIIQLLSLLVRIKRPIDCFMQTLQHRLRRDSSLFPF